MKQIILSSAMVLMPFIVLAHPDDDAGWTNWMMGSGGMMGGQFFGFFGFLFPLFALAFWGLTIAFLVALIRWVWKKGDDEK